MGLFVLALWSAPREVDRKNVKLPSVSSDEIVNAKLHVVQGLLRGHGWRTSGFANAEVARAVIVPLLYLCTAALADET